MLCQSVGSSSISLRRLAMSLVKPWEEETSITSVSFIFSAAEQAEIGDLTKCIGNFRVTSWLLTNTLTPRSRTVSTSSRLSMRSSSERSLMMEMARLKSSCRVNSKRGISAEAIALVACIRIDTNSKSPEIQSILQDTICHISEKKTKNKKKHTEKQNFQNYISP